MTKILQLQADAELGDDAPVSSISDHHCLEAEVDL